MASAELLARKSDGTPDRVLGAGDPALSARSRPQFRLRAMQQPGGAAAPDANQAFNTQAVHQPFSLTPLPGNMAHWRHSPDSLLIRLQFLQN